MMSDLLTTSYRPSFATRTWCVLKAWVRDPSNVATICPSSRYLTDHIANRTCVHEAARIIELGPGAGGTTTALLDRMGKDSKLLAIEKSKAFADVLYQIDDPRLSVVIADALDLVSLVVEQDFGKADVVVSGIPFSLLPAQVAREITQSIFEVLRPDGVFIAYQVRPDIQKYARPLFGPAQSENIAMNLPPLKAFVWRKVDDGNSGNPLVASEPVVSFEA